MTVTPDDIVRAARGWINTPFHHQGRVKGVGCDCLGLIVGVARELELTDEKGILLADYDQPNYSPLPDGRSLKMAVSLHLLELPSAGEALPGDVPLIRFEHDPQHVGILSTLEDDGSTVDVLLQYGSLASLTDLGVLNGGNVALLGNEVIQFANATLLADKKYRLSRLLRGRLGTEHEQNTHVQAERFVLLTANLVRVALQNSLIGLARQYKAVSIGGTLATTPEQNFTYTGKTLRPYSPVQIKGTRHIPATNDWTVTWVRRTRLGGEWRDGVDVPLSEQSELYHVQIMNGITVVRTVEGITTPSLIYTAAQQIADFGSVRTSFAIKIYQVSAIVGRGVPGIATIS